nr:sigma factor-like helix-turn-helix DNA-binding protein [uncultured Novosphingobium sp.]
MIGHLFALEQRIREAHLRGAFSEYEEPAQRRVVRAYYSLPPFHRSLFWLFRFEGQSIEQIAVRFDISHSRAQRELGRAFWMMYRSMQRQERKGW